MFVAWRDLRFAKGRFALMGTVVVLMTMLVGLLSGLTAGLGRENTSAITGLPADHLAFAAPTDESTPSFSDSTVTESQWQQWAATPGVNSAEPLGITTTKGAVGGRTATLSAFGAKPGSSLTPAPVAPGQVVLSTGAAEDLGATPGETVDVSGTPLVVSAVSGDSSFSHTSVAWTSLNDWQGLNSGSGPSTPRASVVAMRTSADADLTGTDQKLGTQTVSRSDSLAAIGSYSAENSSLQMMRGFLFAISALVIGAFFVVWTIQRSSDVAVLKALGASTRYLLRDSIGQATVLLLFGTAVGTALTAAIGALAVGTVPFVLNLATVLAPPAIMIVLGILGAALSLRRVTTVDPLTALGSAR